MTLLEIVKYLDTLDDDSTIFASKPWAIESQAKAETDLDEKGLSPIAQAEGLVYFIEVFIAREFLEDWIAGQPTNPSVEGQCRRLIDYALNDA